MGATYSSTVSTHRRPGTRRVLLPLCSTLLVLLVLLLFGGGPPAALARPAEPPAGLLPGGRSGAAAPAEPDTPTPAPTCGPGSNYVVSPATATLVPGDTLVPGSQGDETVVTIALPFSYSFYG